MKFYFAPLEGVTGYIYRNTYNKFFGEEIDKYFTPFIVPTMNYCFTSKELNDIKPEHNKNIKVIPQILTNNADYFLSTTEKLNEFGYDEINLNLGCPSGTVVSKFKGSGFLAKREELDMFLEEIFSKTNCKISLKTRIGKDSPNEFYELINIFNKYPLEELIIHPRIRQDFYKNTPNMEVFKDAIKLSKNPLVYNGDIFSVEDFKKFKSECPSIDTVMLGRGLMANPGLIGEIKEKSIVHKDTLRAFHDEIYARYKEVLSGDKNALYKMKEFWFYMIHSFEDSEKYAKRIRKSKSAAEYEGIIVSLFNELDIAGDNERGFSLIK